MHSIRPYSRIRRWGISSNPSTAAIALHVPRVLSFPCQAPDTIRFTRSEPSPTTRSHGSRLLVFSDPLLNACETFQTSRMNSKRGLMLGY